MRMILLLALALLVVPAAGATSTARESTRLEPAASFIAGKPVTVVCGDLTADDGRSGEAAVGADSLTLSLGLCRGMEGWLRGKVDNIATLALGIATLTHEAIHLRGESDEGVADCEATRRMPEIARKFFHVKRAYTMRRMIEVVRADHSSQPAQYRTVC